MAETEHRHIMNAHVRNPKYGTQRPDGSDEPEYIPHPDPTRASQTDYRCVECGKSHEDLIGPNDPSRANDRTLRPPSNAVEVKSDRAESKGRKSPKQVRKSSRKVGRGQGSRSQGEADREKAPTAEVTRG